MLVDGRNLSVCNSKRLMHYTHTSSNPWSGAVLVDGRNLGVCNSKRLMHYTHTSSHT